jgi:hypothetical protein
MLNSLTQSNDDKVLAVFQKFNNKDKYVMLENNELSAGYLDFKSTTTEISDDLSKPDLLDIHPNPAMDFIEISLGANGPSSLQSEVNIFNVFGQIHTTPSLRATPPWKGRGKS